MPNDKDALASVRNVATLLVREAESRGGAELLRSIVRGEVTVTSTGEHDREAVQAAAVEIAGERLGVGVDRQAASVGSLP